MSLGGYKFAGYKYTRPADYDSTVDAQVLAEVLKMHKCKLKAFTESCVTSGAQWDFSENAGQIEFETYGNVIYKLDSSGFNLVSFFRYGTDDAYYAIVTLSDASRSSGTSQSLQLSNYYYYYTGYTVYQTAITNDMSCISLIGLTMDNINSMPSLDRLALSSDSNAALSNSDGAVEKSIPEYCYYGYAIKGKCIISIITSTSGSVFVKVSAVDLLELSSPDDKKNIFSYVFGMGNTVTSSSPSIDSSYGYIQTLTDEGVPYEALAHQYNTTYSVKLFVQAPKSAVSINPTNNIPYESVVITPEHSSASRPSQPLNKDGIMTKGVTPIDMMATNLIYPYNNISVRTAYANGNYLNVWKYMTSSYTSNTMRHGKIVYIGWDPSNPDITQESSWPEYSEY